MCERPCCWFFLGERPCLACLRILSACSGGLRLHHYRHDEDRICHSAPAVLLQLLNFLLQLLLPSLLFIFLPDPSTQLIPTLAALYFTAALPATLIAYAYRRHPRRACAHALPSIQTCCRALFAILTAPVCGAALARLALCGSINGLILTLMTPLLMSVYFAKPPEESSLFDY